MLWGGVVRLLVLHHATFSINSLCHFFGRRGSRPTTSRATSPGLSLITFGEAWHNNHHAFPTSAAHGLGGRRSTPPPASSGAGAVGLAWDVVRIAPERMARKAVRPPSREHDGTAARGDRRGPSPTVRSASTCGTAPSLPPTNGGGPTFTVRSERALAHALRAPGQLGIGRAYVAGEIEVDDLDAALDLLDTWKPPPLDLRRRRRSPPPRCVRPGRRCRPSRPRRSCARSGRRHSRERDLRAVRHHYDVGNEFFSLFLDASMTYSCAIFSRGAQTLEEAQVTKLDLVCRKLELQPGERLLDVGCGWGSSSSTRRRSTASGRRA